MAAISDGEILLDTKPVQAVLAGFPDGRIPKPVVSLLSNGSFDGAATSAVPAGWTAKFARMGRPPLWKESW